MVKGPDLWKKKWESLSCDCLPRRDLSATRKRECRVTEGNMCSTQIQYYLVIFALTTRERGGCRPTDNSRNK